MRGTIELLLLAVACAVFPSVTEAQPCARTDFEAVVDQASATLVQVSQKNAPEFQDKLRALKEKRGWSNQQLIKDGEPFVRDEKISAFDEKSEQLLTKINTQASASADCKVLSELKMTMKALVETQAAKWAYMFDKIDKELAKSP